MVGIGLFVAFNVRAIADRLGGRRIGPFGRRRSAAYWRFSGCFVAVISGFWTLAFGSAF